MISVVYFLTIFSLVFISWGFVDANAPLPKITWLHPIVYFHTVYPTAWYTATVGLLFGWYLWILHQTKKTLVNSKTVWSFIIGTIAILVWSYPAFSNDIFNYIATAKVAYLYGENPYITMPIDIPNEPTLAFLHAANKVALYGPAWIAVTAIPHYLGLGNLLATLYTFKLFIVGWYLLLCYLIWIASKKNPWALAFFAFNPLVLLSTLVDGHNDVVMMALALGAFLLSRRHRYSVAFLLLIASTGIKGATILLVPIFVWCWYNNRKNKYTDWQLVWYWSSIAMYVIFFLSPIREEMYPWYFIWPLTFVSLLKNPSLLIGASYGFSVGLLLRHAPFLYTRSWMGITPVVKKIVTVLIPALSVIQYVKKSIQAKK